MKHILVVEDEAIIRQSVRRLLERNGFQITDVGTLDAARALDLKPLTSSSATCACQVAKAPSWSNKPLAHPY